MQPQSQSEIIEDLKKEVRELKKKVQRDSLLVAVSLLSLQTVIEEALVYEEDFDVQDLEKVRSDALKLIKRNAPPDSNRK